MLADRIRCDGQRLHLEQWLNRNDRTRATVSAHTTKSRKDQTNTNTLTRCRSLELLEDDHNRVPNMRTDSSSMGLTRSYDILNTHEVMIHRETNDYDSSTHGEASSKPHSQRRHSINILDNESLDHQPYVSQHSKRCSIFDENANRQTCSEKDKSSRGDGSDPDKTKLRMSVAGRLEELLSKTNEIIEMERLTRAKTKEERRRSRVAPADKAKVSGSVRSSSGYEEDVLIGKLKNTSLQYGPTHAGHANSSFIAQEMEKITTSLLGYRDDDCKKGDESLAISPEIAKEYENQKERASAIEQERDHSSAMSGSSYRSVYVPSFSAKTMITNDATAPSMNENQDKRSPNASNHYDEEDDDEEEGAQIEMPNSFCGFYQNTCFEDVPSSSNNTIKSEKQRIDPEQKVGVTNVDVDEPSELSEMANTRELNELKCRILNGSNWRNQQLQRKNVHDNNQPPNREDPTITNGIIKTLDTPIAQFEFKNIPEVRTEHAEIYALPPRVKVNELVARIQGNQNSPLTINPLDGIPSDSSEDEIDSADPGASAISMNTTAIGGMYVNQNFQTNYDDPTQRQTLCTTNLPDYSCQLPATLGSHVGTARQSQFAEPRFIDTRSLIPKDAYFHELPNKNKLRPITDNQPEPPITSPMTQRQPPTVYNPTARSRNPLPMSVNHSILFNNPPPIITPMAMPNYLPVINHYRSSQAQQPHQTAADVHAGTTMVSPADIQTEYSLIRRPVLPQREKLLANRKFGDAADFQNRNYERIDSSTLSIPSVGCNSVVGTNIVHIDHGHQIERDSNNDSGYSTKMGGGSSLGPSPSLSGHTEPEVIIIETTKNGNSFERYEAVDDNGRYYVSTFGASSLV